MKKLLITLLLFVVTSITFSQARIGKTLKELQTEYTDESWSVHYIYSDDGCVNIMGVSYPDMIVMYQFNKYQVCYVTAIHPLNFGTTVQLKFLYDKKYRKVGEGHWKGDDFGIILNDKDDKRIIFLWYDANYDKPKIENRI